MSQAVFVSYMKKNGGVIINISASLHWNGTAMQAHASAAKAGVDALTKVLACEWGPYHVRVVGIVPGAIAGTEGFERLGSMSNMNNRTATEQASEKKTTSGSSQNYHELASIPGMRVGEVEDISNAGLFLGSGAAAYITGTNIVVDGGSYLTMPNMMFASQEFKDQWIKAKL